MTAINSVSEFRTLFHNTEMLMESTFSISIPVVMNVQTTDAKTIAKKTGQGFRPTTKVAARVLAYAQKEQGKYCIFIEDGSPRLATIDSLTHEMTHIWQYLNWNDGQILNIYQQQSLDLTKQARDIVYEGMAMWASIQLLYAMGEIAYAKGQEEMAASQDNVYGIGFRLYRDRFLLERSGEEPSVSPFTFFPPLSPAEVSKKLREAGK